MLTSRLLFPLCLLALSLVLAPVQTVGAAPSNAAADPLAAPDTPTPVSDFAPETTSPTSDQRYDQGVTISKINIEGNQLIDATQIRDVMALQPGSLYSKNALQADLRRIYEMGYFSDQLKAVPVATRSGIVLNIRVEENVPVTGFTVEGNSVLDEAELAAIFESQTGMPQNINELNKAIEQIEKLYAEKGYVLARVASIQDDPDGQVTLRIDEGMVDDIQFVGNRKTKKDVLTRNMVTKPGQPYNEKVLGDDLKRLYSLQAFDDVRRVITVSPDNPDHYNLVVELDEKRSGALSIGGGFDTGTGLFGTVGYTDPNFLGRGQNFNAIFGVGSGVIGRDETQADARTYQFDVGWSTPSFMGTDNALAVNTFARDFGSFNVPLGIERRLGGGVTVARPIKGMENVSASLGLRLENVDVREGADANDLAFFGITQAQREQQLQSGTFLSLTPTVAYDTRDNFLNPESGWFNTLSLTGAYGFDADSYGSVAANIRRYVKIRDGVSLALNAQAGTSLLGDIPEFNMFRLGGMFSVRGFQEGGLGVGNGYLLGSAELRTKIPYLDRIEKVPFLNSVRLAFFVDGGTVLDEADSNAIFQRDGVGYSVGMGLRVNLPGLGPLRVDYAIPLGSPNYDYVRRFNFGIGQKF